jgi:hypothetical protein
MAFSNDGPDRHECIGDGSFLFRYGPLPMLLFIPDAQRERGALMKRWICMMCTLVTLPLPVFADEGRIVDPLPCGIYDQAVVPIVEKDLETQSSDPSRYTMEVSTKGGKKLRIEVKSVSIKLAGERNHVSVFVEGKPLAKTSHQDLPLYLEIHVDQQKYRIICTRNEVGPERGAPGDRKKE